MVYISDRIFEDSPLAMSGKSLIKAYIREGERYEYSRLPYFAERKLPASYEE